MAWYKRKYGLYPINGVISEIIFGINCDISNRNKIKEAVLNGGKTKINFKEVFKKAKSYDFSIRDYNFQVINEVLIPSL